MNHDIEFEGRFLPDSVESYSGERCIVVFSSKTSCSSHRGITLKTVCSVLTYLEIKALNIPIPEHWYIKPRLLQKE